MIDTDRLAALLKDLLTHSGCPVKPTVWGRALMALEGRDALHEYVNWLADRLIERGVPFSREEHSHGGLEYHLTREGGHSHRRVIHAADATGRAMESTLESLVRRHPNITLHENHIAIDLVTSQKIGRPGSNRCLGVYALDKEDGHIRAYSARFLALATGGACKAYLYTSNPDTSTGDGIAMAWRAGCRVANMEFVQFHPTGMVWPHSVRGTLVTEGVRGDGGILLNNKGERFMFSYIPERFASETADTEAEANRWLAGDKEARRPPELLTRDVVARAITQEVKEGRGSPHGGVFLDIASRLSAELI